MNGVVHVGQEGGGIIGGKQKSRKFLKFTPPFKILFYAPDPAPHPKKKNRKIKIFPILINNEMM